MSREMGQKYEDMIVAEMISLGWSIIHKNYCGGGGEIDIIGIRAKELCFVEVKGRSDSNCGEDSIFMSMSIRKQHALIGCSQHFLKQYEQDLDFEVCYFALCGYIGDIFYWIENPFDE